MENITIGRYAEGDDNEYTGWIEPEDRSWIVYTRKGGHAEFYDNRDPETGAVQ